MGAMAFIVALSRVMHSYSAQADLQNASTNEVPAPRAGQIIPSPHAGNSGLQSAGFGLRKNNNNDSHEPEIFAARNW
jgi:hypothetical protein